MGRDQTLSFIADLLEGGDAMAAKPQTIDEYLSSVDKEKRAALQKLRKAIKAAAPNSEECISYQLPAFRHDCGLHLRW